MSRRDIVAIGASVGGVQALRTIAANLPADFPAAVLAVLHIGANQSQMPALLSGSGPLPAVHPEDGSVPVNGMIHVAPPDRHMVIERGRIRLVHGPKEHHTRPAVDPLFRSAAAEFGERVIGVVLSGGMDDGTAGLQAIKKCGGLAVVQHPDTALDRGMPMSALTYAPVDHVRPLPELAGLLRELVGQPVDRTRPVPDGLLHELANFQGSAKPMEHLDAIGRPSNYACPECHGVLWELAEGPPARFRCHTGHAYSLQSLADPQLKASEDALWAAIRALQERASLLRRLAASAPPGESGAPGLASAAWEAQAAEATRHADQLKAIVGEG